MRMFLASACLGLPLLALPLPAQTQSCASANDANNTVIPAITGWAFAGPGEWAYQFTPTKPLVVRGMRIYTGNKTPTAAFMTLEVWDDDATSQLPKSRLTGGTWQTPQPTPNGWMGTNFDKTVLLKANTPYWLIWGEPGGSQVPQEPSGSTLMKKVYRFGSGAWKTSSPSAFKFRLYCSLLDDANLVPFGKACASAASATGTTFTNQPAVVGNKDFRIEGSGFPAGAPALFLVGGIQRFPSLSLAPFAPGCFLNTDIMIIVTGTTGTGDVRAKPTPGAAGHVALPLSLLSPVQRGAFFATQIAVFDAQSKNPLQLVFGNALRTTVN